MWSVYEHSQLLSVKPSVQTLRILMEYYDFAIYVRTY